MSEILKMTSSKIPSRPPGKFYTEFKLEFWEIQLWGVWKRAWDDGNLINGDECSC